MTAVQIVLTILAALAVVTAAEIYRELHTFKVTKYSIKSEKFPAGGKTVKIVFLSDLHNREYGRENENLYQALRTEWPDLILIGGDMLVGKDRVSYEPALKFVRKLPAICPVYYANGNHEQRMKENPKEYSYSYADYKTVLEEAGVVFLENETETVRIGQTTLDICAVELPLETYRKMKKANVTSQDIGNLAGDQAGSQDRVTPQAAYRILLAHNPAYMDAYKAWGADLILSGHLHGGIVRIPGLGGVISPQAFLFPRYSGELTLEGDQTVIVSRGLGTHTIHLRLFNTPELVSISLEPAMEKKIL
ncbi:MAG TPA: metallophosphoesterase [Candidatus Mediterraneibacter avicola]|nr:metallophosphoesterase [Candidatus Mediterraneibacter avicola]